MAKLNLDMTLMELMVAMSEGNVGCVTVLSQLEMLPANLNSFLAITWLDQWGIYGSDIWILYKDCCGQDVLKTYYAIRAVQLGFMTTEQLKQGIKDMQPIPEHLIEKAKERLRVLF